MLHHTHSRLPDPIRSVEVAQVPLGGHRRYGVELFWEGTWSGTITVQGPRGGVIHTATVAGASGFAAFSGWADWASLRVVAQLTSGTPANITADVYLSGEE